DGHQDVEGGGRQRQQRVHLGSIEAVESSLGYLETIATVDTFSLAIRRRAAANGSLRSLFAHTIGRMDRNFLLIGALFGFLAVALGAFGAHALRARLSPDMLAVFETGVRYHMYHALALVLTSLVMARLGGWLVVTAGWCFVAGILLFSGSLYALALTGVTVL